MGGPLIPGPASLGRVLRSESNRPAAMMEDAGTPSVFTERLTDTENVNVLTYLHQIGHHLAYVWRSPGPLRPELSACQDSSSNLYFSEYKRYENVTWHCNHVP